MTPLLETGHLDESDLLRLGDQDGHAQEIQRWRAHLEACEVCRSRSRVLARRAARLSAVLSGIELPAGFSYPVLAPAPGRRVGVRPMRPAALQSGWLRAAALILLVLLPFVAVAPLRAAVTEWLVGWWAELTSPTPPTAAVPEPPAQEAPSEAAGATLWFAPAGEELRIRIASAQAAGSLVLSSTATPEGFLEVVDAQAAETPLISERGVSILNTPASAASYKVGVPAAVRRVRVEIGDAPPVVLERAAIEAGRTFGLQARAAPR